MTTKQTLVSQSGLTTLLDQLGKLDFRKLCVNRLSRFVPSLAVHWLDKMMLDLSLILAVAASKSLIPTSYGPLNVYWVGWPLTRRSGGSSAETENLSWLLTTPSIYLQRQAPIKLRAAAGKRKSAICAYRSNLLTIITDASLSNVHSGTGGAIGN